MHTKKILLGLLGLIFIVSFAFGVVGFFKGLGASSDHGFSEETVTIFRETLTGNALARGPHPIEGFSAYLLLQSFPGLEEQDFDGVESFEGEYWYENGALRYRRTASEPYTSAEQTISAEGYGTLLKRVSDRLDMDIDDRGSIEELVRQLEGDVILLRSQPEEE